MEVASIVLAVKDNTILIIPVWLLALPVLDLTYQPDHVKAVLLLIMFYPMELVLYHHVPQVLH